MKVHTITLERFDDQSFGLRLSATMAGIALGSLSPDQRVTVLLSLLVRGLEETLDDEDEIDDLVEEIRLMLKVSMRMAMA